METLNEDISEVIPELVVASIVADENVEMELVVTVDATESTTDIEQANQEAIKELEDQGFSTDTESNDKFQIKYLLQSPLFVVQYILLKTCEI